MCACVYICAPRACNTYGAQERALEGLKLQFREAVRYLMWVLGIEPRASAMLLTTETSVGIFKKWK